MTAQYELSPEGAKFNNENGIGGEFGGFAQAMRRDIALETFYAKTRQGRRVIIFSVRL
jgi:hypothetical protein